MLHISFTPEEVFKIGQISITNSLITAFLALFVIIILSILLVSKLNAYRPKGFELFAEILYDGLISMLDSVLGREKAEKFFSFLFTFFVFIIVSNWLGIMPFVGGVGYVKDKSHKEEIVSEVAQSNTVFASSDTSIIAKEIAKTEEKAEEHEVTKDFGCLVTGNCILTVNGIESAEKFGHIFRAPTADISSTLAFALISVIVTNIIGLVSNGFGYMKKYFDFSSAIGFVVGILELVSELGKIISFTFRLFGNVFAGEVMLAVITAITFGVATLPFLGFEVFVGFIQAFVFFMLTAVFIGLATEKHH